MRRNHGAHAQFFIAPPITAPKLACAAIEFTTRSLLHGFLFGAPTCAPCCLLSSTPHPAGPSIFWHPQFLTFSLAYVYIFRCSSSRFRADFFAGGGYILSPFSLAPCAWTKRMVYCAADPSLRFDLMRNPFRHHFRKWTFLSLFCHFRCSKFGVCTRF